MLLARFASFIAEKHPFALRPAVAALETAIGADGLDERDPAAIEKLREHARQTLARTCATARSR